MKIIVLFTVLLIPTFVLGFAPPKRWSSAGVTISTANPRAPPTLFSLHSADYCYAELSQKTDFKNTGDSVTSSLKTWIPAAVLLTASLPAEAATTGAVVPTALWAYAHYFSIIVIFGCLAAERTIVKAGMTEEEENTIVKLDLVYGLMAFLL